MVYSVRLWRNREDISTSAHARKAWFDTAYTERGIHVPSGILVLRPSKKVPDFYGNEVQTSAYRQAALQK